MTDPLTAWLGFLASPAAPRTTLSPLELDGYLTGIIVAPDLIKPSEWILGLWGEDEPVFDDADQMQVALDAVRERYNALVAEIDDGLRQLEIDNICRYRPMFMAGDDKPSHDAVRNWVKGFWRSMALAPESWLALAEDERTQVLIGPFVGFIDVSDRGPFDWREDADEFLDADAEEIPRILLVLRKLGQIRASRPSAGRQHRSTKIGRNDPCHCGSGRKYKRCCGAN